jgi:hypothetical protein
MVMLMTWNHSLIDAALDTLTPLERSALSLFTERQLFKYQTPQPEHLEQYAIADLAEYYASLITARQLMKQYFASLGINRVDDLPFEKREVSSCGALYTNPPGHKYTQIEENRYEKQRYLFTSLRVL